MYHHNDFEAWRAHRDELLREADERRLARQARAVGLTRTSGVVSALLERVHTWSARKKGMAEC